MIVSFSRGLILSCMVLNIIVPTISFSYSVVFIPPDFLSLFIFMLYFDTMVFVLCLCFSQS